MKHFELKWVPARHGQQSGLVGGMLQHHCQVVMRPVALHMVLKHACGLRRLVSVPVTCESQPNMTRCPLMG